MKKYNFGKGLRKGIIGFVLFAIPFLITSFPEVANLTIGGLLLMLLNYFKVKSAV